MESTNRKAYHICVDAVSSPTHSLDACLQGAAATQTMSGLSLTPPTPLRILLKQTAWERLQDTGRQKEGSRWAGVGKDAGGEEAPRLPSSLNIISCSPGLTEAQEIVVKRQPEDWRTRCSEAGLLVPAPADGDTGWLSPGRDAPNTPLMVHKKACLGSCTCGAGVTVLAAMASKGTWAKPHKQLSSPWGRGSPQIRLHVPQAESQ